MISLFVSPLLLDSSTPGICELPRSKLFLKRSLTLIIFSDNEESKEEK